jgi:hypothetical protein
MDNLFSSEGEEEIGKPISNILEISPLKARNPDFREKSNPNQKEILLSNKKSHFENT